MQLKWETPANYLQTQVAHICDDYFRQSNVGRVDAIKANLPPDKYEAVEAVLGIAENIKL